MPDLIDADKLMAALAHRRSFKPAMLKQEPVSRELIEKILEAANWAPSHGQTEPWRFVVFAGEGRCLLAQAIEDAYRADATKQGNFNQVALEANRERAWAAPAWIAIAMSPAQRADGSLAMPEIEEELAVACAVENMHLMASALGLGAKWTTNAVMNHPVVAAKLGLNPPAKLMGFFFVGWPSGEWPAGKRRPVSEKTTWHVSVNSSAA